MTSLREHVLRGTLDAELAALVGLLVEHGVPLVVAATDLGAGQDLLDALTAETRARHPARDVSAGGVVFGTALEDVLRVYGVGEITDDMRGLGIVLVLKDGVVAIAHYVRPVERDGAGHLQRRPPAILSARDSAHGPLEHYYWAYTEELATRAGLERAALEDEVDARRQRLTGAQSVPGQPDARH